MRIGAAQGDRPATRTRSAGRASEGAIDRVGGFDHPADRVLVSVIVPAFNAGWSIERALRSVLADSRPDLECIVVDDASTDDTPVVVERLAAADPRIVLLRAASNEGVSSARNRALTVSRGEWLAFLDADDRLRPGWLAALLDPALHAGALAVIGQRIWTDGHREWLTAAYDIPDIRTAGRTSLPARPGLMFYASATGKLFHRSLAEGLRFTGRVLGDQPWTIRALIRAGDRIQVIDRVVYEWIRPRDAAPSTITAAKRGSSRLAAEAVRVAIGALAEVVAEGEERLRDPAARRRIVLGYFERLIRSDFAGPVRRAVIRGDDGSAELFDAISDFLASAPPHVVEASDGLADAVLRAPLDRWLRFREPGRGAYLRLLRRLLAAHPDQARRLGRGFLRLAVWLLRSSDGPAARRAATALLAINWPFGAFHRLRRFRPPRMLSGWPRLR